MFLSCLLIEVGDNPDRPRPGRLWLRNRYRVHQRLCMAFPTPVQRKKDPDFLLPYEPCGFQDPRPDRCFIQVGPAAPRRACALAAVDRPVHVPRGPEHNFLFRLDPQAGGGAVILVQSAVEPDWGYAFHNARYLIRCYDVREFSPSFSRGQALRFRLDANPTRRLRKESRDENGDKFGEEWAGKRVPVPSAKLEEWLTCRAEDSGFRLRDKPMLVPGYTYVNRSTERGKAHRLRSVRYEGQLEVTDPDLFRRAVIRGIGSGKAFGFGLLSVAPVG